MKNEIFRKDHDKKRCILYIDDLSLSNRLKFTQGKLSFYDLDIRMFKGYRISIEKSYIKRGYSILFIHENKTRLLVFNRAI